MKFRSFAWFIWVLYLFPARSEAQATFQSDLKSDRLAVSPGWLGQRHCLEAPGADTLTAPPTGFGSISRLLATRQDQPLLVNQDFEWLNDATLRLANPLQTGESLCVWTFDAPLFTIHPWALHAEGDMPFLDSLARDAWRRGEESLNVNPLWANSSADKNAFSDASSVYRLDFNGSKTMAVSVGDGGGVGLDATLVLDVKGQLAENVFVEGRLSDQNVPLQPEGNTATLKELDTKYIKLYGKEYDATLGDFDMHHGREGLDGVHARVSGIRGRYSHSGWELLGGLAQSQGLYRNDTLRGIDGKQRGYYLRGKDGRTFIRVMPGTEKVWRNGSRLERGLDYTIDYADGRLDFLNRIAVNSENLFSVEFEYAEDDYSRNLASLAFNDSLGRLLLGTRVIRLNEDPNNPLGAAADSSIRSGLSQAGDGSISDTLGQTVRPPEMHAAEVFEAQWKPSASQNSDFSLVLSQRDANLYSNRDDNDNQGLASHYEGRQIWGNAIDQKGIGEWDVAWLHDYRSSHYSAFNQLVEARGFRDLWNLSARTGEKDFAANRLQFGYRPFTRLKVMGEAGLAQGNAFGDTGLSPIGIAQSQRYALTGSVGEGTSALVNGLQLSTEAKLAQSPLHANNYRQQGHLHFGTDRLRPELNFDRNEWVNEIRNGGNTRSLQFQPSAHLHWQTPYEALTTESGLEQVQWQSQFGGHFKTPTDSVRLLSVEQRVLLSSASPLSADGFYRFQQHDSWSLDGLGQISSVPRSDQYHLFEGQTRWNQSQQGFSAATTYKVQRTAELPLVDDYRRVEEGRGQFDFDSLLNAYHAVETGGDFVLFGLKRDTTLGTRPYQDVQWTAEVDLIPAHFPFALKGVLADLEFSGQVSADLQDSGNHPPLFPLLNDAGIRAARSGHARFQPQLRWHHPDGTKHLTAQVLREYGKNAGVYASLERNFEVELIGRRTWSDIWDASLTGRLQSRERQGESSTSGKSIQNGQTLDGHLQRQYRNGYVIVAGMVYSMMVGDAAALPYSLTGWRPSLRLEKAFPGRGRAYAEYALQTWFGSGFGDYYALGGYTKGLTHRFEASADFELQAYLFLHTNYLLRFEPDRLDPSQRFNAEVRAVF